MKEITIKFWRDPQGRAVIRARNERGDSKLYVEGLTYEVDDTAYANLMSILLHDTHEIP